MCWRLFSSMLLAVLQGVESSLNKSSFLPKKNPYLIIFQSSATAVHFEKSTNIELIWGKCIPKFNYLYHFCLLSRTRKQTRHCDCQFKIALLTILKIETRCLSGLSSNNIQIRNSKHASFFMVRYFGSPADVHHYIFCSFSGFGCIQITLVMPLKHQQNTLLISNINVTIYWFVFEITLKYIVLSNN